MEISLLSNFTVGPLMITLILGFTTLALVLWYSRQKLSYWKKVGIPHAKSIPLLGSIHENVQKPLHETELDRYKTLGRIYGHYEGSNALISIGDPKYLRSICVKDFHAFTGRREFLTNDEIADKMINVVQGEDWKRIRSIVSPTFTTRKIKKMLDIFKECAQTVVKNFKDASEAGKPVEIKRIYGAFTMDVIASSAFSTKIDSHNDPNNPFVTAAKGVFSGKVNWRFVLYTLMPSVVRFLKIPVFPQAGLKFFKNVTLEIIEERKRTGQRRNDFLQLLLDAASEVPSEEKLDANVKEDDIAENYGKVDSDIFQTSTLTKRTLSHNELIAQCAIFFLAGYETTASTLSFVSYCLALNPDIQEKLIKELDEALKTNNGELSYEVIQSMKYLDNVIAETMRIYPPAIRLERKADENYKLEDTNIVIPKGMHVTIPIYAMHRDPEFFPNPEKFDPDRFTTEERMKRDPYVYLPFGVGPRNCVGMRFALLEVKTCLAHMLRNFRFKKCPETKVPLEWHIGQGLLQAKGITLKLEIRRDTVKAL